MKIEDIKALELQDMIDELRNGRITVAPDIKEILKSIDVKKHPIFDETLRLDKMIKQEDGSTRKEPVARIGIALQKLIVKRAVAFLFGNPVEYNNNDDASDDTFVLFNKILQDTKINSFNRKLARDLFTCTEVAELWYPVPIEEKGVEDKFKIRVKKFSVLTGDLLFPYFDEYGDLTIFSREYETADDRKFFEVYTKDTIEKYDITEDPIMAEGYPIANPIGKIPIVYANQAESAYYDVDDLIQRLEKLLSNFADTNDYHASPKLFVQGTIKGFSKKGESGAIIEGEPDAKVTYLSWANAPESVKTEIATLKELIYTISQTPDISFDSVKGIGGNAVSAKALKFMFLDAHLKVMDNMEVFDEYLERRTSIVKAFIGQLKTDMKGALTTIDIDHEVTPYMFDDINDKIEFIMTANGNKPVISEKTGVKLAGLVEDIDEELNQIDNEKSVSVFEPTRL